MYLLLLLPATGNHGFPLVHWIWKPSEKFLRCVPFLFHPMLILLLQNCFKNNCAQIYLTKLLICFTESASRFHHSLLELLLGFTNFPATCTGKSTPLPSSLNCLASSAQIWRNCAATPSELRIFPSLFLSLWSVKLTLIPWEIFLKLQQLEIYSFNWLIMQFICYDKQRINHTTIFHK